jgi:hypothetical protein
LSARQIGETWLNYIIEYRTILWWGGMSRSTEHTAWLRLRQGHAAPASGSIALNGRAMAEQIGAQFFADGWALANPGGAGAGRAAGTRGRLGQRRRRRVRDRRRAGDQSVGSGELISALPVAC